MDFEQSLTRFHLEELSEFSSCNTSFASNETVWDHVIVERNLGIDTTGTAITRRSFTETRSSLLAAVEVIQPTI